MNIKFRILYPHNIRLDGFDLEPLAAFQSETSLMAIVENHRLLKLPNISRLQIWGLVKYEDYLGWYPSFSLSNSKMTKLITDDIGTEVQFQNHYSHEVGNTGWRRVDFKKIELNQLLEFISGYEVHFHVLKSPTGIIMNYGR